MLRALVAGFVLVASLIAPAAAAPAAAADPTKYHVIDSYHADGHVATTDETGCLTTDVWLSSGWGAYQPQPPGGRPTRQGLTTIDIFVTDVRADETAPLAAAGGGGVEVAHWFAQVLEPLVVRPNLSAASYRSVVELTDDVSGEVALATIDVTWAPAGFVDHYTVNLGDHVPRVGMVRGTTNAWIRDAMVAVDIDVGDGALVVSAPGDGHLERVKWTCIEIVHPHTTDGVGVCI